MNSEYFNIAFEEAKKAYELNEVPVGAVIVKDGEILAKAYNQKEKNQCAVSHAEIHVIEEASKILNNWRLDGCELYVTLDPCPMCASAIKQARIQHVYSALHNSDSHNLNIIQEIFQKDHVNPEVLFDSDLDMERSKEILNSFFEKQRNS